MFKKFFSILLVAVLIIVVSKFTASGLGSDLDKVKKQIANDILPELNKVKNELYNEVYTRYPYVAREDEINKCRDMVEKVSAEITNIRTTYEEDDNINTLIDYCSELGSNLVAVLTVMSSCGESVSNGEELSNLVYNAALEEVRSLEQEYDSLQHHLSDILETKSDM